VDGKFPVANDPLPPQPQPDWNDEIDEIDDAMAHQELSQLQQFLGLVTPKDGKPVQDVTFVSIDCEAFEFDHNKITEIGKSQALLGSYKQN
jgi:FKBP-type peptidyl-prolyl cis-trans isomerase (trigger factor)